MRNKLILSMLVLLLLFTSACNYIRIPGINPDETTYYIDYENGTIPISELPVGSRLVDISWEWEYRFGENYSKESLHSDQTDHIKIKPVTWIIVAHDFYEDSERHVTLLSEDLIAYYAFDDSTNRGSVYGSNHWGDSGTADAIHGLRPWLNSEGIHEGEGFYQAFSVNFKHNLVNVDLQNCEWENNSLYTTTDKVFIPSGTEMGDGNSICGHTYPYFKGFARSWASNRIAEIDSKAIWYWTRTPVPSNNYMLNGINPDGGFMDYIASHGDHAVRPVVNLSAEVLVSESKPLPTLGEDTSQTTGAEAGEIIDFNEDGISFNYPTFLATDMITEYVPGEPDCDFLSYPDYTRVTFDGYIRTEAFITPALMVFTPDEYSLVMEFAALQIDTLEDLISNETSLDDIDELPFLPVWNASQHFHSNVLLLNFKNGKGIRYLTQYVQDTSPIINEHLFYTFQGLTDDRLSYISFTIPVTHPNLPVSWDHFFDADDVTYETFSDNYQGYLLQTINMLEETEDKQFTPSLQVLDEIVASLQVE